MAIKPSYTADEVDDLSRGLASGTPDDVSITRDGVRIDSKEKLLVLIAEHEQRLEAEQQAASAQ
jgi:hypothetical protein